MPSPFLPASLNARNHIETYGLEKLDAQTLRILKTRVVKDLKNATEPLLELERARDPAVSSPKTEIAKAIATVEQIKRRLSCPA